MYNKRLIAIISSVVLLFCGVTIFLIVNSQKTEPRIIQETPIENTFSFENRYQLDYSIGASATDKVFEALKTIILKNQTLEKTTKIILELKETSIRDHSKDDFLAYSFDLTVQDYQYSAIVRTDNSFGKEYIVTAVKETTPANNSYILITPQTLDSNKQTSLIKWASSILSLKNPSILTGNKND